MYEGCCTDVAVVLLVHIMRVWQQLQLFLLYLFVLQVEYRRGRVLEKAVGCISRAVLAVAGKDNAADTFHSNTAG